MAKIYCRKCGAKNADDIKTCPHCGSPMNNPSNNDAAQRISKFIIFFVLLVLASIFFMLWLPR